MNKDFIHITYTFLIMNYISLLKQLKAKYIIKCSHERYNVTTCSIYLENYAISLNEIFFHFSLFITTNMSGNMQMCYIYIIFFLTILSYKRKDFDKLTSAQSH